MADPQVIQQTQTTIPDYARPYVERMLGRAETATNQPYQYYPGQRFANVDPLTQQAYNSVANMGLGAQAGNSLESMYNLARQAGTSSYGSGAYGNQYQSQGAYNPTNFGYNQVGTSSFTQPGSASAYMSPYMQNVVDIQQREAQRQADIAGTGRGARAAQAGAFGGSRQAIENAEAARNLATQKGDIQAQGLQSAYQAAQGQFNAEQQARLQANLANQQAGLTTQQQQEMARQYGYGQQMVNAANAAQYGQAANQLNEQSRQYGAGYGLQALQSGMQGMQNYGSLSGLYNQQQQNIANAQNQMGQQAQNYQQQQYTQNYNDFVNQRDYPIQQLGQFSNMLRGLPLAQTSMAQYQQAPSMASQLAGFGTAALGVSQLGRTFGNGNAKGGMIRTAHGLPALAISQMG